MVAGEGTRMKSSTPKVLHKAAGKPLAEWVVEAAVGATERKPILIYGSGGTAVPDYFASRCKYVCQEQRLGSGHAVRTAYDLIAKSESEYCLVMAGDMPLIRKETLEKMMKETEEGCYSALLLSAVFEDATGYGRIVRRADGSVEKIVEHNDATPEERKIKEINASVYCFKTEYLLSAIMKINNNNAKGEYYLTDAIEIINAEGGKIGAMVLDDSDECMGVNDRVQLAQASAVLRRRIVEKIMRTGVTMIDPSSVYIDAEVQIGNDTVIYPGVIIEGSTKIGKNCVLYQGSRIENSEIGDGVTIQNSVVTSSKIGNAAQIGPYAYLRPGSNVGAGCRIGDFVEIKNSKIDDGSKVSHLTYVGDSNVGKDVNIGCGVVFVNYDGAIKARTNIGDGAFIGCNTNLISPVNVGDGAYIAAGSTVTVDIPENALCIARAREVIKPDRAKGRYKVKK